MVVTSAAFKPGGAIPQKYTCDGQDVSPPLEWKDVPAGARTLALICEDPDAPRKVWVHWVLFNIPASTKQLPESVPARQTVADGARHGKNDFGNIGYGGPCPPSGTHRYYFKLYALDTELNLKAGSTNPDLLAAMEGHILQTAELMGTYTRSR